MHRTLFSNAEWIIIMINKIVHCYLKLNIIYRIANSRILCSFLSSIKFGSMNPLYTHFQMEGKRPVGLFPFESAKTIQNNSIFVFVSFYWHFFLYQNPIPYRSLPCKQIDFIHHQHHHFFSSEKNIFAQFGCYSQIPHRFLLLSIAIETAHILILCLFWLYFAF